MIDLAGPRATGSAWAAVFGVSLTVSACSETPREPVDTGSAVTSAAQNAEPEQASGEAASEQAIVVRWENYADTVRTSSLSVRVQNTTGKPKTVRLELIGVDPRGRHITRPLDQHLIPPRSAMPLTIPLADLPSQSVRLPSTITVVAHYEQSQPSMLPEEPPIQLTLHASSALRFVTFDPGFQIATVRSEVEQLRANTAALAAEPLRPPTAGELRLYRAQQGEVVSEDPATLSESESGVVMAVTKQRPVGSYERGDRSTP